MRSSIIISSCLVFLTYLVSCEGSYFDEGVVYLESNRERQIRNLYDNGMMPDIERMSVALNESLPIFETLKELPTAGNLQQAQAKIKALNIQWEALEVYRFGSVKRKYEVIQFWPYNDVKARLDAMDPSAVNFAYIESQGSAVKGLLLNSFLLYSSSLTDLQEHPQYLAYVLVNLESCIAEVTKLKEHWKQEEQNFKEANSTGLDQSQDQQLNIYVNLLESIKLVKLEEALKVGDILKLEAPYGDYSIELIQMNLKSIQKSFNGDFSSADFPYGFDDYLRGINYGDLSETINEKMIECIEKSNKIQSLNQTILEDKEQVEGLVESVTELLVLIKVDAANVLGTTITFTDNDGD